ncbi:glycosyltransferase [Amycolatopsis sp. FBCC-B4732]|uniref:glycosyltransferase n=1 Tax=Amycolatopsis sp. FBCC-B4732 TaxID=3079339 RepID=UPI001FF536A3|nr:glycosyltransferase [Amycolatopsis sp. FBCC-B4732]UOX87855.1 glycosyltransferase [Amycolatopsis sp. FBCC-B4732]
MRVLFAGLASAGHTYPMVPLAIAARDVGHEVHFAAGEHVHAPLRRLGLGPFRPADAFYEIYAEDLAPDLARLRPDLVVHGWGVPEAGVAARRAGIPALWHGFGRLVPEGIGFERPSGGVHVDICPPSLQDAGFLATAERIALRPVPLSEPAPPVAGGPLIFLTLGTAFGTPEVLTTAIRGLAALGEHVVVATGRVPPADLGEVPGNVTVRAWVEQTEVVPHADLVVHHGGSGTTLGALAAGVPQLVLPQGADQFANAEALLAAGAAVRLLPGELSADAVTEQARQAAACRDAARALAEEIAGMPSPAEVARELPKQAK